MKLKKKAGRKALPLARLKSARVSVCLTQAEADALVAQAHREPLGTAMRRWVIAGAALEKSSGQAVLE